MSTILDSMKAELARLEAETKDWSAQYDVLEREFSAKVNALGCKPHYGEIDRLKQAIAVLERA